MTISPHRPPRVSRAFRRGAVALLAVLAAGAGGAGRGAGWLAEARANSPLSALRFGFNEDFSLLPEGHVALARSLGAGVVRFLVPWGLVQHSETDPISFTQLNPNRAQTYAQLYAQMRAARVQPIIVLSVAAPRWAQNGNFDPVPPPPSLEGAYMRYVRATVRAFPGALAVEVGNEPNVTWKPRPDPAAYAHSFDLAARAVRSVRPRLPVLIGGLAPTDNQYSKPDAIPDARFLTRTLRLVKQRPDAVADHPYTFRRQTRASLYGRATAAIYRRVRSAARGLPVWVTETGVSSTLTGDEGSQATADAAIFQALRRAGASVILFHHLIEWGKYRDGYGFVNMDESLRPVARTMRALVRATLNR